MLLIKIPNPLGYAIILALQQQQMAQRWFKVKAEILVFHGEDDKMITADQVDAFKKEMDSTKVKYTFVGYPKALHGFTNPDADKAAKKFSLPVGYDKEADEKSWAQLLADLKSRYAQ